MNELAHYYFSPAVRRGLSSAIAADATGARAVIKLRAEVVASGAAIGVTSDAYQQMDMIGRIITDAQSQAAAANEHDDKKEIARDVELYGPGDVLGFSEHAVARTEPREHVRDFEPNYLASIDFVDPDFPWRYSPLAAGADGKLTPWIALIVLEQSEFKVASEGQKGSPAAILVKAGCLPDLSAAALWAHVQLTGNDGVSVDAKAHAAALGDAEASAPERVLSRLICPRRLKPATAYYAFVVPSFKLGCVAARVAEAGSGDKAVTPAWAAGAAATLPCYYSWEFSTGQRGDFEYLVRLLKPRTLTGLGIRPIDCSDPGYNLPPIERADPAAKGSRVLGMEGALRSVDAQFTPWGKDDPKHAPNAFQKELAEKLLNKYARELAAAKNGSSQGPVVPSVVPPVYGSWFAARKTVDPSGKTWLDELNLDPRHRAAAALGTLVVHQHQEALMNSAWHQLGEIEKANAVLREGQLAREAAASLHKRLDGIPDAHILHMTSPLHARIRDGDGTVATKLGASRIPIAAMDPAMRRMFRAAAPLRTSEKAKTHLLERLKDGSAVAAGEHPKLAGHVSLGNLSALHAKSNGAPHPKPEEHHFAEHHINSSLFKQHVAAPDALPHLAGQVKVNELRDAVCSALDALSNPDPHAKAQRQHAEMDIARTVQALKKALDPRATIHEHVLARVQIQLSAEAQNLRAQGDPLAPVLASPDFPQPMYEAIRDISQDLILPGVETVPENTVALLETNRRFLESYMVGLNHAFTSELLWRGAPVGGRYTYFRQFWDVADTMGGGNAQDEKAEKALREKLKDIKPLTSWGDSALGKNDNRAGGEHAESLVLLVRGSLLKKYPNTLVYAVAAAMQNGKRVPALPEFVGGDAKPHQAPIFHGTLSPDLTFFGFNFTEEDARGNSKFPNGIFFILEERLSETRFGLDELEPGKKPESMKSWDDLTWDHVGVQVGGFLDNAKPTSQPSDAAGLAWGKSSAQMAHILLQRPARIAVHAERILPSKEKALPPKQVAQPHIVAAVPPHMQASQATIAIKPSTQQQHAPPAKHAPPAERERPLKHEPAPRGPHKPPNKE